MNEATPLVRGPPGAFWIRLFAYLSAFAEGYGIGVPAPADRTGVVEREPSGPRDSLLRLQNVSFRGVLKTRVDTQWTQLLNQTLCPE